MSSKNSKSNVDDISRETQRLIKDSHVHLPYHKPKQKSLKDFLNRHKITKEYQASITGSKKLLQKAWELIESKEQNVEKFYNEDSIEDNTLSLSNDTIQAEKNLSLEDSSNCNTEKHISSKCINDEENFENNSVIESESSAIYDDDENSREAKSVCSEGSSQEEDENSENNLSLNNLDDDNSELEDNIVNQFIDDEAESSELDCSSDDEDNFHELNNESEDDKEFSIKKKRQLVLLSESSDDDDLDTEIQLTSDDLIPLNNEPAVKVSTQQLMNLCSGQFNTQESEAKEDDIDENFEEDDFDSEVPQNDTHNFNDNNLDSNKDEDNKEMLKLTSVEDFQDDSDLDHSQNDTDSSRDENELKMLKLTSAKDYFDDEAELSESDWSSDDEEHLVDSIDKLEEEAGDKDKLDEDVVKNELDKIYMRQLLDDDQQQVTALKEMLLEDGELHSDSGRKRKFQWDEVDENDSAFKKPLFSDNEDENDDDEVLSDDEKSALWRKDRFKRESYLSQKYNSEDEEEIIYGNKICDITQKSVTVIKKMHVVKYNKNKSNEVANTINIEEINDSTKINEDSYVKDNNSSTSISITTDTTETNEVINNGVIDIHVPNVITQSSNKFVKGSFMKRNNDKKTLLYINKKSTINNEERNGGKYEEKNQIKSMTTITSKAGSNPFAYLLRNDKNPKMENITNDSLNVLKKENLYQSKPSTSVQSTQQSYQTKSYKSTNSILKHLD